MSNSPSRYRSAVDTFKHAPQFQLSSSETSEVKAFEKSLSEGRFPVEYQFLQHKIRQPDKDIFWVSRQKSGLETICLDWFLVTKPGKEFLLNIGYSQPLANLNKLKTFLSDRVLTQQSNEFDCAYIQSRKWAQKKLEENLKNHLEGNANKTLDLHYLSLLTKPKKLLMSLKAAHELKSFYSAIDAALKSEALSNVNDAKSVMILLHIDRLNELIAETYRMTFVLLEQYRYSPSILTSEEVNDLMNEFGLLKKINTNDLDKMAKLYSELDKFITGLNIENSYDKLDGAITELIVALQHHSQHHDGSDKADISTEIMDEEINADQLKKVFEVILKDYDLLKLLNQSTDTSRADTQRWAVKVSKVRESLSVNAEEGVIWIPQNFRRKLCQKKPVGVIPLLNHEIMHVLQHRNGANLGIELLEKDRAARASIWFEVGATEMENSAFNNYFGIERGPNLHYLRALQTQINGGSLSDCIISFYKSLIKSGDISEGREGIGFAVERTMRIFRNGTEFTVNNKYITNYEPLEFAEEELLVRNLPQNLYWLFYVGRASFQTLAELYRIGWLKKENVFMSQSLPGEIGLRYLTQINKVELPGHVQV